MTRYEFFGSLLFALLGGVFDWVFSPKSESCFMFYSLCISYVLWSIILLAFADIFSFLAYQESFFLKYILGEGWIFDYADYTNIGA